MSPNDDKKTAGSAAPLPDKTAGSAAPLPDKVTLTIDGEEITVPKGTLVIRAAEQLGVIVPRFCDHPLLDPIGACRQCIVEVEGQRKPMMACTTTCTDEMVVKTHLTSEMAAKGQAGTLEFLLINHPLDCPMCDKGGECPLQDQALNHGSNESRFVDEKRRYQKPVAVSQQILLDRERCVLCARCTRFSNEISGDPFIELFERGALEQVAIYEDEPYASYFSGNVIQICPVGALTSASYRFKARPFDVRTAPSVCGLCSAGCTLTVQSRHGEIQRQLARTNMPVNEAWNCDKGRFGFKVLTADARVTTPLIRRDGELAEASWAEALTAVTSAVAAANEKGTGRVAVVTGSRLADEDAYAVSKYVRTVLRSDDVDFRTRFAPDGERASLAALAGRDTATYADVEQAPVILTVGLDPEEEVPILHLRIRKAWRNHSAKIVPIGPRMGSLARFAYRRLATAPGGELDALRTLGAAAGAAGVTAPDGHDDAQVAGVLDDLDGVTGAVILVGERAPDGAIAAAGRLADAIGAKLAWVPRRAGARGALDAGLAAGTLPGGRSLDDADDRTAVEALWGELPTEAGRDLHAILTDAAAGRIDVLHLIGVDLVRDAESAALAEKALSKVGTVVVQDLVRNATSEHADVVLPVTATQERAGTLTNWEGRSQRHAQAVAGPELVQDDWEVLVQLAALQGHDLGWNDLDALRGEMVRLGPRGSVRDWPEVPASGGRNDGADEDDGLLLLTYPLLLDRGTMLLDAHDLNATARQPFVALHPSDADRLAIADGSVVEVTDGTTAIRLPAKVEDDIVPGAVYVPTNSTDTSANSLVPAAGRSARVTVATVPDAEVGA